MTQFINPFSVLRHFNMIVRDSGGNGNNGGNNDNGSGSSDPGSGTGDDGWGDWDDTADWGQDDSYDYGYDDNDNDNNDYYYDEPLTPIAPPSTPTPYEPPGYDFGGGNDPDPVTYPAPPPDPILPNDPRGYPDVYDPTPFEGPATDDDLGLTDAPISDYLNTEDPYEPNLLDPQTDDDLGFEDTLDTTDIFGPDADLIQDPVTGYVRPMTTQEMEQGALETRFSYAAPDNVLNQDIGDLSSATFDTGATITGTSPTDTTDMTEVLLEAYNYPAVPFDRYGDTSNFNIGGFDTGPDVDTTAPSGLTGSTGLLGDPINLGTLSPTDQSGMGVEFDSTTPNAGAGFTDAPGVGTETHSVTIEDKGASPSGYNSAEDASDYNQSFDPTDPTGFVSPADTTKYDNATGTATDPLRIELTNPMDTGEETKITINASGAKVYSNGMTEAQMRALYGQYGTAPNDTESKIMRKIMATERHAEDGPIDPKTGKPIYNSGDLVFDERGIDKFNSAANDVTGFFLQGISNGIFGRNFSKNQARKSC
jgi:hypothetical protein